MSSFFTLSGFLIATLAIDEWRHTGHLSWRRFWERRARRLLPAALVTIAAVLAIDAWRDVGSGPRIRGDALAALGYVANWRQAAGDGGYAAIFSSPSPFVHFWSLAIEEQFYVLFPLVFAGVMALAGRRLGRGALVFGTAAAASFGLAWVAADRSGNDGIAYYGTHTRAGELLAGVALAYAVAWFRDRHRPVGPCGGDRVGHAGRSGGARRARRRCGRRCRSATSACSTA